MIEQIRYCSPDKDRRATVIRLIGKWRCTRSRVSPYPPHTQLREPDVYTDTQTEAMNVATAWCRYGSDCPLHGTDREESPNHDTREEQREQRGER